MKNRVVLPALAMFVLAPASASATSVRPAGAEASVRAIDANPAQAAKLSAAIARGDVAAVKAMLKANGANDLARATIVLKNGPPINPMKGKPCKYTHTVKRIMHPDGTMTVEITDTTTCG